MRKVIHFILGAIACVFALAMLPINAKADECTHESTHAVSNENGTHTVVCDDCKLILGNEACLGDTLSCSGYICDECGATHGSEKSYYHPNVSDGECTYCGQTIKTDADHDHSEGNIICKYADLCQTCGEVHTGEHPFIMGGSCVVCYASVGISIGEHIHSNPSATCANAYYCTLCCNTHTEPTKHAGVHNGFCYACHTSVSVACDHDYQMAPTGGGCHVLTCTKCGDCNGTIESCVKNEEGVCESCGFDMTNATIVLSIAGYGYPALLSGGGIHKYGDEVTISVTPLPGVTFHYWTQGGHPISSSPSFVVEAIGTLEYEAVLGCDGSRVEYKIQSQGDGYINLYVDDELSEDNITSYNTSDYTGMLYTIEAVAREGSEFLYWIDENGKVISTDESYSFYLLEGFDYTAVFQEIDEFHASVVFRDINGKVVGNPLVELIYDGENESTGAWVDVPSHGYFSGYEFIGWVDENGNEIVLGEEDNENQIYVTGSIVIYANYNPIDDLVLIVDGDVLGNEYSYGELVVLNAEEQKEDKYFSGWYSNDVLVSDALSYSFRMTKDTTIVSKYLGDDTLEQSIILTLEISDRENVEDKEAVTITLSWSLPDGMSVIQAGIVRTLSEDDKESLKLTDVNGTAVKKNSASLKTMEGIYVYTLTLSVTSKVKNVYTRGYLIYRDNATGVETTVYTEIQSSKA